MAPAEGPASTDRTTVFTNRYEDTERPGQGFWKMMLVWHGSVFKLIWPHLTAFILAYAGTYVQVSIFEVDAMFMVTLIV
jgi:predicted membrane chloride channel (bestrophin family)